LLIVILNVQINFSDKTKSCQDQLIEMKVSSNNCTATNNRKDRVYKIRLKKLFVFFFFDFFDFLIFFDFLNFMALLILIGQMDRLDGIDEADQIWV